MPPKKPSQGSSSKVKEDKVCKMSPMLRARVVDSIDLLVRHFEYARLNNTSFSDLRHEEREPDFLLS